MSAPDTMESRSEQIQFLTEHLAPNDVAYNVSRIPDLKDDPSGTAFYQYVSFIQLLYLLRDESFRNGLDASERELLRNSAQRYNYSSTLLHHLT